MQDWLNRTTSATRLPNIYFDSKQMVALTLLCLFGFVILASASFDLAQKQFDNSYHYITRQSLHLVIGLVLAGIAYALPSDFWFRYCTHILIGTILLLILVLFVGEEVKGSQRWLRLPLVGLSFQPSEFAKFSIILFVAQYIARRGHEIRTTFLGFLKPVLPILIIGFLLLLEPDYGSTVFIFAVATGMLFLAGACLWRFGVFLLGSVFVLAIFAYSSPYRHARLTAFIDPWSQYSDGGHQLVQSLVAIGSGSWFGQGLGNSMQKQFYLSEVQNDFIFAVIGEELGFVGVLTVVLCYLYIVWRCFSIAQYVEKQNMLGSAYIAYGIGLWFGIQAFANIAVAMGVLPTKGTTLPLISMGGSSLIIFLVAFGILQRIYNTATCADPSVKRHLWRKYES